jgi:threonine dehydrogenase-like Zn-dependent dehydrogenase
LRALVLKNKQLQLHSDILPPRRGEGEVLIRIDYAGICRTDLELVKGYMKFDGVPGHEFVGTVEEDGGEGVVGERVVSEINCACGVCDYCQHSLNGHCPSRTVIGILGRQGSFADYISVPYGNLHVVSEKLPELSAVFVEPFAAALKGVEDGDIRSGHRVAILGDGNLGLLVTMVAALTDCELLLIGKHPEKMKIAEDLGVKTLILNTASGGEMKSRFDRVVDCTGSRSGLDLAFDLIKPCGKIVMKTTIAEKISINFAPLVIDEVEIIGSRCGDFERAIEVMVKHRENLPVERLISGCYDLEDWEEAISMASGNESLKILFSLIST